MEWREWNGVWGHYRSEHEVTLLGIPSHGFCQPFSWRLAAPFSCAYVHQGEPSQTRQLNHWTPRAREIIFKEELQKHGDQQNASLADQEGVGWSKDLCDLANLSRETTTVEAAKVHLLQHCWSSQRGPFKCRNRKSFKFTETDTVIIEVSRYLRHFEAIDRVQCSIGLPALIPPPRHGRIPTLSASHLRIIEIWETDSSFDPRYRGSPSRVRTLAKSWGYQLEKHKHQQKQKLNI